MNESHLQRHPGKAPLSPQKHLKSTAGAATPFKPLSTPNHKSTEGQKDLASRIAQLHTTIAHTRAQLVETLHKLDALRPFQQRDYSNRETTMTRTSTSIYEAAPTIGLSNGPDLRLTPSQAHTLSQALKVMDKHIALLKQYNELKDAGMMMTALIAEREGRVVAEVLAERGITEDD